MATQSFRKLSALAVALIAPACAVFLTACEPECVDRYDCRDRTDDEGHEFVCEDGKCVVSENGHDEDGGEQVDAGETDAGQPDAGETDAGQADAGAPDGGQTTDGGSFDGGLFNTFHARMTGEQVVPPNTATTGAAIGVFAYNTIARADGGHELNYNITWSGGITNQDVDQTHIHVAPGGVTTSTIALTLAAQAGGAVSGTATISPALAADIEAGRAYVDIHTQNGPNVTLTARGQIIKPGERLFIARLNGAQAGNPLILCTNPDFPAETTTNYCGGVQVLLSADQQSLRYTGRWDPSVVATASHIHEGGVGQSGNVTVTFSLLADGGFGVEGGPTGLAGTDAGALDGGYYVNVHTADAGAGLIRGQLFER